MSDITMCAGNTETYSCPKKEECYRCQAPPNNHWQAYFVMLPVNQETNECEYFMEKDK